MLWNPRKVTAMVILLAGGLLFVRMRGPVPV